MLIARWILQVLIALILLASSVGKALDLPGFVDVLATWQTLPEWAGWPTAVLITLFEAALAIWLLSAKKLVAAAGVAGGMHLGYASVATVTLLRGIDVPNCGCFGVFLARPLTGWTVAEDVALVLVCATLVLIARHLVLMGGKGDPGPP